MTSPASVQRSKRFKSRNAPAVGTRGGGDEKAAAGKRDADPLMQKTAWLWLAGGRLARGWLAGWAHGGPLALSTGTGARANKLKPATEPRGSQFRHKAAMSNTNILPFSDPRGPLKKRHRQAHWRCESGPQCHEQKMSPQKSHRPETGRAAQVAHPRAGLAEPPARRPGQARGLQPRGHGL